METKLVEDAGLDYQGISSGKLRRYFSWKNFSDPFRVLKGYFQAKKIIRKFKPDIVFSKGGFVTVPVVFAAAKYKVPVIIHESDMTPGLANKLAIKKATKVCHNFPETAKYLGEKAVHTGSPIRAELFTGNNLMTLAVMNKKITTGQMLKNWSVVWVSNLVGSVLLALIVVYTGVLDGDAGTKAIAIAEGKASLSVMTMIGRGILCNVLVVLAVWMATSSQDIISKIFACWFPIMLFVLCGFEHSVANMYFIPAGMLLGAKITMGALIKNLVCVTIGNILGGAIIVPCLYHATYLKDDLLASKQQS